MGQRIVLNLNLDSDLVVALDEFVASRPGENRSSVARKALSEYLRRRSAKRKPAEDAEDAIDRELGNEALRRLADPDDETIPWEQAKAELGL